MCNIEMFHFIGIINFGMKIGMMDRMTPDLDISADILSGKNTKVNILLHLVYEI